MGTLGTSKCLKQLVSECVTYLCKCMGSEKAWLSNPSCTDLKSKPSTLQYMPTYWHLLQVTYVYKEQYKSKASYFFFRNYNYSYNAICTHHGYILCKVEIIFPQIFPHYQNTISTFAQDAVCRLCKTHCFTSELSHTMYFSSSLSVKQCPQTASFRRPKKFKLHSAKLGL